MLLEMATDSSPRYRSSIRRSRPASFFQAIVEHSSETIFVIDLETDESTYVSPAVRALLGREPDEMIGRPLTDFVHPDDAGAVRARSVLRRRGEHVPTAVTRMCDADGAWVWVQTTASPVVELEGRFTAVFTVTRAAERVRSEIGLRNARIRLRRVLERLEKDAVPQRRDDSYDLTVEALAAALELRDDETGQHTRRVTNTALSLTHAIDPRLALEPDLRHGFLLHDIGKIGIPDAILLKRGPLTEQEMRVLQMHTTLGEHLVSLVPFVSDLAHDVVAFHHERWDGGGYPWGLARDAIPLPARIFAVADAFDAITNDRPYAKARSVQAAIAELERGAGAQFDPVVVSAFVGVADAASTPDVRERGPLESSREPGLSLATVSNELSRPHDLRTDPQTTRAGREPAGRPNSDTPADPAHRSAKTLPVTETPRRAGAGAAFADSVFRAAFDWSDSTRAPAVGQRPGEFEASEKAAEAAQRRRSRARQVSCASVVPRSAPASASAG